MNTCDPDRLMDMVGDNGRTVLASQNNTAADSSKKHRKQSKFSLNSHKQLDDSFEFKNVHFRKPIEHFLAKRAAF